MISAELRRIIRAIYAFACGYCGVTETEIGAMLTLDHYQPVNAGGSDDVSNLVYACHACNMYKSAAWNLLNLPVMHPLRAQMNLHIRLLPDGMLEGLTPEGMRHIETLHLNRDPMVRRRKTRRLIEALLEREAQIHEQEKLSEQELLRKQKTIRRRRRHGRF